MPIYAAGPKVPPASGRPGERQEYWIPASAGMTRGAGRTRGPPHPASLTASRPLPPGERRVGRLTRRCRRPAGLFHWRRGGRADETSALQGGRRDLCATRVQTGCLRYRLLCRRTRRRGQQARQGCRRDVCASGRQTGCLRYREADGTSAL